MKLPSILDRFLPKKQSEKEIFSSVVLDEEYAATTLWEMGDGGVPKVLAADSKPCAENTWEARLDAVDEALATVEDAVGTNKYSKVVLGLPTEYLTAEGEISKEVRPHIKSITRELELTPIGFVSLPQAILYRLKKEEGIPPSVILLDVTRANVTISLYRVGALTGEFVKPRTEDTAITLEEALKEFKNLEVLPARILLYGHDGKSLEEVKTELLRYPWTTRVNFLHFPKIEIVAPTDVAAAVSLAGASELAHEVGQEPEESTAVSDQSSQPEAGQPLAEVTQQDERPIPTDNEETLESVAEAQEETEAAADAEEAEEILREEKAVEAMPAGRQESNVVAVDPSRLGFRKNVDVLENVEAPRTPLPMKLPAVSLPKFPKIDTSAFREMILHGGKGPIIAIAAGALIVLGLVYWFVPHVRVTVMTLPKSLTASEVITIDPSATSVEANTKIIPGTAVSKSESGTKTVPVTGKKNVGDPAKGSVTVYNKSTSSDLTITKGTVLTSGSLEFTVDADVDVASASTTISDTGGSTTFGTANVNITASQIGTDSNLPAGTSFTIKGYSADSAVARNAAALAGGTSKTVTVVSRADQDSFVKGVSGDLVDKAKQELSGSVTGSQKLIDETITTAVTEKTFKQEIDQEATSLTGTATITVSGTTYNTDDVSVLLKAAITSEIPSGYTLAEGRTQVTLDHVKVGKDGKISANATIKADAVPTLDAGAIRKNLSGKSITAAQTYLRSITGVAAVEFRFSASLTKSTLPANANNISVSVTIQ